MSGKKYYEAYDDRYRQVHSQNLEWFSRSPSPIVSEIISEFSISRQHRILEIGCGEGRDAFPLLNQGYDLLATDISPEAIAHCCRLFPEHRDDFRVLNCVTGSLEEAFDFIYAVAVVHMLVTDGDRDGFYDFIRRHLKSGGIGLICSMGDGEMERSSDIRNAFDLQERIHGETGNPVQIAATSCRMVSFPTFQEELERNGLQILKTGITAVEPDFPVMMYAVVTVET